MSKTGSTKNKILNLMLTGNKTLSDISATLDLAPSTVSQHLQELKAMGAIKEVHNDHVRKWRYYELNPDFNYNGSPIGEGIEPSRIPRRILYYALGIGTIAALAYLLYSSYMPGNGNAGHTISYSSSNAFVPITLTDPPNVPNGTQSLTVSYSSVAVHVTGPKAQWIESTSNGSVNLLTLLNVSQVIAGITIASNSAIDAVRLNISSANITINGTVYNVTVPNDQITTQISGNNQIASPSGILMDISPTIVAIYTSNSSVFVMVPDVKAIVVPNANTTASAYNVTQIGKRYKLPPQAINSLVAPSDFLAISNATLVSSNDNTMIRLNVTNRGNQPIDIRSLLLVGIQTPIILYNSSCGIITPNENPVPLWCQLINNQVPVLHGRHKIIGSNAAELRISSTAGISSGLNSTATSALSTSDSNISSGLNAKTGSTVLGNAGAIDTNSSDNVSVGLRTEATSSQMSTTPSTPAGNIPGESSGPANTTLAHFDFGVGDNGINQLSSGISPVDIRADSIAQANAILSVAGDITTSNWALMHLITPLPEKTNSSVAALSQTYVILPEISANRAIYFLVGSNGTLAIENRIYGQPLDAKASINTGHILEPGQSVVLTFNSTISLPGGFVISLAKGSSYRIEVTVEYGQGAYAYGYANVTSG